MSLASFGSKSVGLKKYVEERENCMQEKRGMITAHSGCEGTEDNSLEFIQYALKLPVDAIEVDVRKTEKGELILSHDEAPEAVGLDRAFLLLREYPDKRMNCDLKQKDLESDVMVLAEECGVEKQLIFTGDVNPELFRKGAVRYPKVLWFANTHIFFPGYEKLVEAGMSEEEELAGLRLALNRMLDYETGGINWSYKVAEKVWKEVRELGIGISVWTVNDLEQQKLWRERQAENITTRKPTWLLQMRDDLSSSK